MDAKIAATTPPSWLRLALWLSICGSLVGSAAHATFDGPIAFTETGFVVGTETPTMKQFLGIPYAAPPVGELRWRPPERAAVWSGVRDATQFANHCAQIEGPFGDASVDEDCLYLNVYVPKGGNPFLRPVMVWFHYGGHAAGQSDDFGPARLVAEGVVVITVNYRLGWLGFLAHPALTAESAYGGSGNYGIMDEQAALRWVRRNALFFGGNPAEVTIFGESSGGVSVQTHLASPESGGLFDRAIVQSSLLGLDQAPLAVAESEGQAFAAANGCEDQTASCLRALPVETILANQSVISIFRPNLDNHVLTQTVRSAFTSGDFNRVPVIQGTTHDEWRLFVAGGELLGGAPLSAEEYPEAIASQLGLPQPVADFIATFVYPLSNFPSPSLALSAVGTDAAFACMGRTSLQLLSQHVPSYAYEFDDPDAPAFLLPPVSFPQGSFHASDVQYLFDVEPNVPVAPFTGDQLALADAMIGYWTRFADSGDPNGPGMPFWPRYAVETDEYQSLTPPSPETIADFAADHLCDFWAPPS